MTQTYYSHGKLIITAEYLVLDGAKALAIPTKKGQKLEVTPSKASLLQWTSILHDGTIWLEHKFQLPLEKQYHHPDPLINRLHSIFSAAQSLNPDFLSDSSGYTLVSTLEFPKNWGLGSSSTLISNISQWAGVDPYELLAKTFGGSGYDIACAQANGPILFNKFTTRSRSTPVQFAPSFRDQLYFIYLNRKQNSRESIKHYRSLDQKTLAKEVVIFSEFTDKVVQCTSINEFKALLEAHENRLSDLLKTPTIKSLLFPDYRGSIKSLGGWGGDFVLVTGTKGDMEYFKEKKYSTILSYEDMIL